MYGKSRGIKLYKSILFEIGYPNTVLVKIPLFQLDELFISLRCHVYFMENLTTFCKVINKCLNSFCLNLLGS